MHLYSYLQSAAEIIGLYNGEIPFAAWLKNYFRQHKKFGSKDRRLVSDLCFCYFRLGKAFDHLVLEKRFLVAQFLCHKESPFIAQLRPEWHQQNTLPLQEKCQLVIGENAPAFFPFLQDISKAIDKEAFNLSHLVQPDLFLRTRPRKQKQVEEKLQAAGLPFSVDGNCVRLSNSSKVDEVIDIDKEAFVQDKSSQQVLTPFQNWWQKPSFTAWDCCAASGGKTILLHDNFPQAQLTVSDIRESILHNLRSRFKRAGISGYRSFVADASSSTFHLTEKFDLIICDAPCSGSGTWGRTPEQLRFFLKERITHYSSLQKSIAANTSRCLAPGGAFLYITCSVFEEENENVVAYLQEHTSLRLKEQQYFTGYAEKADTLFAALFAL